MVKGNNNGVVRRCMELRKERWEETSHFDKLFNFKWQPVSRGIQFDQVNSFGTRQLVNHIQFHSALTTKDALFENLLIHCEQRKIDVFKFVPVTFCLQFDSLYAAHELEKFISYFHIAQKSPSVEELNPRVNAMQLPQLAKLNMRLASQTAMFGLPASHFIGKNIWILKATTYNCGIGIHVFSSLEELRKIMREYLDNLPVNDQVVRCLKLLNNNTEKRAHAEQLGPFAVSSAMGATDH